MAGRPTVENVDIQLTATDKATKVIDGVAKAVDDLDANPTVDVKATGTAGAVRALDDVDRAADDVDTADPTVKVDTSGTRTVEQQLADIRRDAKALAERAYTIDVDVDGAEQAKGELADVGTAGETAGHAGADGIGDIGDALGALPGPIGEVGNKLGGITEIAAQMGPKLTGALAGLGPILAGAGVAVVGFFTLWADQADAARKKLEEVKGAQLAMASGDITKATTLLSEGYAKYADTLNAAGISQAQYAEIITKNIPLTDEQKTAIDNVGGALAFSSKTLEDNRRRWAEATAETTKAQSAQFEMAKALGATTDQLLGMAGSSLPAVQAQILAYVAKVNGIPASRFTEITTDADPDDVKQVEDEINHVARDRDSTVDVDADTSAAEAKLRAFTDAIRQQTHVIPVSASTVGAPSASRAAGGVPTAVAPAAFGVGTPALAPLGAPSAAVAGVEHRTYYVQVIVPPTAPTADYGRIVADALDAHERRTGRRRRAVA